jgi:hypothetical protein
LRLCIACEQFGILPAQPAMDPTGSSTDEADRLCRIHRERVLRGSCFLCGVGLAVLGSIDRMLPSVHLQAPRPECGPAN